MNDINNDIRYTSLKNNTLVLVLSQGLGCGETSDGLPFNSCTIRNNTEIITRTNVENANVYNNTVIFCFFFNHDPNFIANIAIIPIAKIKLYTIINS